MEEKMVKLAEGEIFLRKLGKGPLLVLLHGFGETGDIWREVTRELEGVTIFVPDLPGSGKSPAIKDLSMEGQARFIHELIQKEAPNQKLILIGHSMGGYITLAYAEAFGETLEGFGLFHSSAFADSEEKKETRRKGIHVMEEKGAPAFLKTTIPNMFSSFTKKINPELIEELIAEARNFSAPVLVSYYKAMMERKDRTEVLKKARVPVLIVLGEEDTAVPVEDGLKQTQMPQLSYIHVLQNSGHMGMLEEPETSHKILKNYILELERIP